jgi:PHD/YefM family antitoxin component YafN of YafNO toxin-antitoxin module
LIEKHGRSVVIVISVEEYERLHGGASGAPTQSDNANSKHVGNRRTTGQE